MTQQIDIPKYLESLSDADLMQRATTAAADLEEASRRGDSYDPEWHGCCFAGLFVYANEMNRRGLKMSFYSTPLN